MRFNLVLGTLLCFFTWMSLSHATHGPRQRCCVTWSNTKTALERIRNYTMQFGGVCPIKAVIFHTVVGKNICSNPDTEWARKAILKVDNDRKALLEKETNEERSTRSITPAFSSKPNNTPKEQSRRGQTQQGKKNKRGRKRLNMCS